MLAYIWGLDSLLTSFGEDFSGTLTVFLATLVFFGWVVWRLWAWRHQLQALGRNIREFSRCISGERSRDMQELREEKAKLQAQKDALIAQHATEIERLKSECDRKIQTATRQNERSLQQKQDRIDELTSELEATKELRNETERKTERKFEWIRRRYNGALSDKIWLKPPGSVVPPFMKLSEFKTPIISLFNLKGGVGKTTLCANLAATFWNRGERVLLIDLDYQASLTCHCLTVQQLEALNFLEGLPHVLQPAEVKAANAASENDGDHEAMKFGSSEPVPTLLGAPQRQIGNTSGYIIPTSEELDADEARLMVRWVFGQTNDDLRFQLRSILHRADLIGKFDRILIDCPPRLTTASVNALAASHFTIVPALPDVLSTKAVPRLLKHLQRFQERGICPHMKVLGVVANKAHSASGMSTRQERQWHRLSNEIEPGLLMKSFIPQKVGIQQEDGVAFETVPKPVQPFFNDLADEVNKRINQHASV